MHFSNYHFSAIGRYSLIRIAFLNELPGALAEDRSCLYLMKLKGQLVE